jgi:EmrB/QacA subfamily drug resistance transporter
VQTTPRAVPTSSSDPAPAAPARRSGPIVLVLALAVFMSGLDLFIVNLAFPSISRQYPGTSLGALSWVLNAYTIVFAAVLVPAGRWADRIGRRRVFTGGLAAFGLGSVLCALAPGVPALIAARVVQAAGAGLMVPASLSLLLSSVPAEGRGKAIGTWSAFGAFGAAVGPVVGGSLVQLDWRWVFWVNAPVALVALFWSARVVPESKDERTPERPDLAGAGLLCAAVGLLALALVEASSWGWGSGGFLLLLAGAALGLAGVVLRSRRHAAPVLELGLLRSGGFSGAIAASLLYYAAFGAWLLALVEFLTGVWHYSPVRAGLAIAPGPLTVLPFARVLGPRLGARLGGPGRVAAIGCALNLLAQGYFFAHLQAHPAYLSALLPAQLVGGAGVGLTIPSLIDAGTGALPAARFGTGSGVLNMARQIGTVIGVAALIAVLSHHDPGDPVAPFRHSVVLVAGLFGGALVTTAALLARRRRVLPEEAVPELAMEVAAPGGH